MINNIFLKSKLNRSNPARSYRDEPRMGTVYEKRDIFLNPIPSNVTENDIKQALALYNIGTTRITVLERLQDKTRYAFVSPQSPDDFQHMTNVSVCCFFIKY